MSGAASLLLGRSMRETNGGTDPRSLDGYRRGTRMFLASPEALTCEIAAEGEIATGQELLPSQQT